MSTQSRTIVILICACLLELVGLTPGAIGLADAPALSAPSLGPDQPDDPKPALPAFGKAEPMPAMDALFRPTDGWIGADGAHSVALTDQRTLWLFSDTWVGKIRNNKRTDATMVNNTLAIQEGRGSKSKVEFVIRHGADNKPTAFITPADGKGFYWLQAGAHGR